MAYEKLKIVNAGVSGDIYLARVLADGKMGHSRKVITDDVLLAAAEWFLQNKKQARGWVAQADGTKPHLFFTNDPEKAERILAILKEETK